MKKIALISFGCAKNLVDSEVMLGYMEKAGYSFVTHPEEADILILNTCGFIEPAKKEARDAIKEAAAFKKKKKEKKVMVVGCYVERYKNSLEQKFPEIDVWLGVNDFDKIVPAIEGKSFEKSTQSFLYDHASPRSRQTPPAWSYVKISEGCSHECSFCAIPLIKGPYQSRPIPSIVKEVETLSLEGVKEVNLISQDTTYFGRDKGMQEGLTHLLRELMKIKNIDWIRILYGYPEEISDSVIEIMQEDKICSYLDIPFQHSEPNILKKMKRAMDGKRALKLLEKLRNSIPDIVIRTSLVVGFPGEGKKEFDHLKRFVQEAQFDYLGVFTYSKEEDTSSFSLGDPIKESVKTRRRDKIMEIQADISFQKNERYLNQRVDALIEGTSKDNPSVLIGRGRFQAPEVDSVILIEKPDDWANVVNKIQKVEITGRDVYDLYGQLTR
ncbi:MAG: 30S ribosomal protein S12 methylthiotransferase RimO [Candidatus Aminicenantes bacterium]|nr:MAG: 30S ribosomal protein S12 methylthiotransferase RimO [Candidatus Aminicenantes bacterium]